MTSRKSNSGLDAIESNVQTATNLGPEVDFTSQSTELPSFPSLLKAPRTTTVREELDAIAPLTAGVIVRINDFGLCEVNTDSHKRAVFMLDKLSGYAGQPLNDFGLRVGTKVYLQQDTSGRVSSVRIAKAPSDIS